MNQLIRIIFLLVGTIPFQGWAQKPVKVSDLQSPNEPSIVINRKNPDEVLCGVNLNNLHGSHDAGKNWMRIPMQSSHGVWGDPVVISDTSGRYYYFHLSNPKDGNWIDRIVCQVSEDYGNNWSNGSYTGLNGTKAQDKHWVTWNEQTNELYLSWTQFDHYGSDKKEDYSNILFSRSSDNGLTWSTPVRINTLSGNCIDSSLTTEGAVPTYDNNHTVYVSWAGPAGLVINRSYDGGKSWGEKNDLVDSLQAGWNYSIPGISRCNGMPITICDRSRKGANGVLYVNWSDQYVGKDDTNVWLRKSMDGGKSWSDKIQLDRKKNDKHQFLTWMTLDQTTGYLYFIFYDRSRFSDNRTDVVFARSYDGGETFKYKRIRQKPFVPVADKFFGDYNNIDAHNGIVQMVWTRMDNKNTSVWTARYKERKKWLKKALK